MKKIFFIVIILLLLAGCEGNRGDQGVSGITGPSGIDELVTTTCGDGKVLDSVEGPSGVVTLTCVEP